MASAWNRSCTARRPVSLNCRRCWSSVSRPCRACANAWGSPGGVKRPPPVAANSSGKAPCAGCTTGTPAANASSTKSPFGSRYVVGTDNTCTCRRKLELARSVHAPLVLECVGQSRGPEFRPLGLRVVTLALAQPASDPQPRGFRTGQRAQTAETLRPTRGGPSPGPVGPGIRRWAARPTQRRPSPGNRECRCPAARVAASPVRSPNSRHEVRIVLAMD